MEDELVHLLGQTQSSINNVRQEAELHLLQLQRNNEAYPLVLASIAGRNADARIEIRQAALLNLKTFVTQNWSTQFEEFTGLVTPSDDTKARLRQTLLELATNGEEERKIQSAASVVVSKVASADYPSEWPGMFNMLQGHYALFCLDLTD